MRRIGLILIVLLGIFLRLIAIDKSSGLWNDEYVSYMIASSPLLSGFIDGIKSQCHMPFYYIYLKTFMVIFNDSDLVLRLSSVFAGVLSIIVMYYAGLEKDKQTGMLCAAFSAISSFLIYYSQEVRLYSLLFLFSALALLFTLRLIKDANLKNFIWFIISSFLILLTHTIGFVFVFFNMIFVSCKLFKTHKKLILKLWAVIIVLLLLLSPQLAGILFKKTFSQWWGVFSSSALGFLITDYFSPVLTNFTGAPPNFFYNFKSGFIIFAIIPSVVSLFFLGCALKERVNRNLLYVVLATIGVLIVAAVTGKLVFVTKYSIEIYPILIYLVCAGAASLKNKVLKNTLIAIFCILNLFFLAASPLAANRIFRKEGHKLAADLITGANLKKGDFVIIQYYDQYRFSKYYDFSNVKVISMNKANFAEYIKSGVSYAQAYNDKNILRQAFEEQENKDFENRLFRELNLKENQSVLVVSLNSVSFFNSETVEKIAHNEAYYRQTPVFFMVFSYLKNQTYKTLMQECVLDSVTRKGEWSAAKFTKVNKED